MCKPQLLKASMVGFHPLEGFTYSSGGSFRTFHTSRVLMAKVSKKGGKGAKTAAAANEEDVEIVLPDMDELDENMERKIIYLTSELGKIRGGRATADMLNFVVVDAYGDRLPITDTAQISLKTPTKLVVSTFDAAITPHVATAIRECGLGFAPVVEGTVITVTVPKPSKEARESLCKVASKLGEQVQYV